MQLYLIIGGVLVAALLAAIWAYGRHARSQRGESVSAGRTKSATGPLEPESNVAGIDVAGLDFALVNLLKHASTPQGDRRDPEDLLEAGLRVFAETGGVSTLVLQRRLQLDFAQATILIDEMERRGFVTERSEKRERRLLPAARTFLEGHSDRG